MTAQGGFAKPVGQLKVIALDEAAVAVKVVGPVGGTAFHVEVTEVSALACPEAADAPLTSSAFTT